MAKGLKKRAKAATPAAEDAKKQKAMLDEARSEFASDHLHQATSEKHLSIKELIGTASMDYLLDFRETSIVASNDVYYNGMMDDADNHIEIIADAFNVPLFARAEFRRIIRECAAELSKNPQSEPAAAVSLRCRPTSPPPLPLEKCRRPDLPKGLEWPEEDYGASPEAAGGGGILAYLVRVWQPILDAGRRDGRVYVDRRIIADWYPGIVTAIGNYRRPDKTGQRREIPENLRFPTLKQVNDAALAAHPDVARLAANRIRNRAPLFGA